MAKWVYGFGDGKAEGSAAMRDLLGGKGANLAEMANLGLPVPPGFTISTEVCTWFYANERSYPAELKEEVAAALAATAAITGKRFGDTRNPLLVSVRSGARASMPGMMDTVLNLGLNDQTVETLAAAADPRFAWDSYRRFVQMYSDVVLGVDHHEFESILELERERRGYTEDTEMTAADWQAVVALYKKLVEDNLGEPFPQEPEQQLWGAIGAVFGSWMNARAISYRQLHDIPGELGHGRHRPVDGVRQHGRDVGDRRRLHPQSVHRREGALRRVSRECAGRGCGRRHPHAAGPDRSGAHRRRLIVAVARKPDARCLCRVHADGGPAREPLSRHAGSRIHGRARTSSGCCRRAPENAPPRPR